MGFKKVFSVIISLMLLADEGFAGYDDGVSQYYYNGMPGCGCFASIIVHVLVLT